MKKLLSCCAAFSLALLACSDDSSPSAENNVASPSAENNHAPGATGNVNLQMASKCFDDGLGGFLKKTVSAELDKAYLTQDEDGDYQILVPELSDYCDIMAHFKSKRLGDTLEIWFDLDDAAVTNCMCVKDHLFDIMSDDADAKYFKYSGDVFEVTSEPAPERPEIEEPTIPEAPEFSESDPHQTTTDVIGKCKQSEEDEILVSGKYIFEDSWSDFSKRDSSGEKITPFAITHSDGDDFVLVFEASFDCNQKVEKVNVYPSNDTLYAKTETSVIESVKLEPNEGCGCMTRAAFKLKNEGAYAEAKYMVFDNHMEYVYTIAEGTEK